MSLLLAFSLIVYDYASYQARERFSETLSSLSKSVLANLDSQVGEMNRLSLTLVYSQLFQELYRRHLALPDAPSTVEERIAELESTEALIEICDTILGPNQAAPQINLFDPRGQMIGAGYYSRLIERDVRREPWFAEVQDARGERVILPPHADELLDETSIIVKDKRYVSLLRSFADSMRSTWGIIEVKQYCDVLFSGLDSLAGPETAIFVVDGRGRLMYPYDGTEADGYRLLELSREAASGDIAARTLPGGREPQIVAAAASRVTGWTVLIGQPATGLYMSITQYAVRIALITVGAILCSLLASFFIARRVTIPIKALHAEIEEVDIGNLEDVTEGGRGEAPGEIDSLRLAFHKMRLKLNDSIRETVALRAHEKEAQLVALQSQLNPHFIHNMLQTIAVMAEGRETAAIQGLIVNLAKILRYASSTEETTATLGLEAEYAACYLASMRARFGESLSSIIDLPETMRDIVVPKLILQPFIENCLKYVTTIRPPWRIELRGTIVRGSWEVEILDNGPGFPDEALELIRGRIAARDRDGLPALSISGMGILNTYERLKITFGSRAAFEIGNRPEGGARVAMGVRDHG